jgi:putative ABC transport system permease protein
VGRRSDYSGLVIDASRPHSKPEGRVLLPPLPAVPGSVGRVQLVRALRSSIAALGDHRWRSAMTMLSVLIGVAAVLVIDAVGHSQRDALQAQLAQLGTNVISVQPGIANIRGTSGGVGSKPTLKDRDVDAIRMQVPHIVALTPQDQAGFARVSAGHSIATTSVIAANPELAGIQSLGIAEGTFFGARDEDAAARVAVIGQTVVDHLFPGRDPLGQQLRVRNIDFTVIGVLTPRGRNVQSDLDDVIMVPFSTGERYLFGPNALSGILVEADDQANLTAVMDGLKTTLRASHDLPPGRADDFQLTNFQQAIDLAQQQASTLTRLLTYVAAIALAMGGLGIMNIMLLAVTERTREIGIMIAVGAQRRDVLLQFLIEAVALSVGGGVGGVALGFGLAPILARLVANLAAYPELPSAGAVGSSLAVSLAIGVGFGVYPAARAAWLDPIVALRAE